MPGWDFIVSCDLQLRAIPVKPAEDDELEEEAEWIYRNAFSTPTISMQVEPKYSYNNGVMLHMLKNANGDGGLCSRKAQTT